MTVLMQPMQENPESHSYYDTNLKLVRGYLSAQGETDSVELLASFKTILDFKEILFREDTDLAEMLDEEFIRDILLPDLSKVSNILGDYSGGDRRGIDDASQCLDLALKYVYLLKDLIVDPPKVKDIDYREARSETPIKLRNSIRDSYRALQHLQVNLDAMTPKSSPAS